MRVFVTSVLAGILLMVVGCSQATLDVDAYMMQHEIKTPSDMNEVHWKKLFANVPEESRSKIIEKLDALIPAMSTYREAQYLAMSAARRLEGKATEDVTLDSVHEVGHDEWGRSLRHSARAMTAYPVILNQNQKQAYWKESIDDLLFCLDDRLAMLQELTETENAELARLQSLDATSSPEEQKYRISGSWPSPFLRQLTEEQKKRLRDNEPLFNNPFLGNASLRDIEAVVNSYSSRHNPAQAYLLQLRDEELADKIVTETPELDALNLTVGDLARWDGSTSLKPLAVIIATHIAKQPWEWDPPPFRPVGFGVEPLYSSDTPKNIVYIANNSAEEISRSLFSGVAFAVHNEASPTIDTPERKPDIEFINAWKFSQTHEAIVGVINGTRDLALVARMPSEDERNLMTQKNVELEYYPFAKDAFVFIANRHNPVRDLTVDQARSIFSGKLTRWGKILNGSKAAIIPLIRNRNSGSEELMRELVMKDVPVKEDLNHQLIMSMSGVYDMMEKIVHGIGYTILYYDRYMVRSPYTRTIRINGVEPTPKTVADGSYPLIYECVVIVRKDGPDRAKAVARWLTREEGANVIRESGYVPITDEATVIGK